MKSFSTFLFLIVILFPSCQQERAKTNTSIVEEKPLAPEPKVNSPDDFLGEWKFSDPHPSEELKEHHYMIIEKTNIDLVGWYFGTTDDFDQAREGYFPGFFVAKMENLSFAGDTIKFSLKVQEDQLYEKPIPLNKRPEDEINLPKWEYGVPYSEREYVGILGKKGIEFDIYLSYERVFVKQ
ncbi:hypothetical protein EV198_1753 [Roseivirga ehrenbergii]|uniref:Uncharacterized protein n=1 Tax=Roseivirga ehrenbergii (strain DSM 102268 / JCM 13514 / KCTC 12282 / NCIMB 14502 / KMM 6017) TaxID=279360 RepID=A0A150XSD4_ROSEK|nr:hypothetical protein [Roseivirga ehrenbergii]KYG81555.1 hypothetical protein MB14_13295 [Roseivirga ehrenbergii]TCL10721.1 hypothetical protein EV198_1753 [Roseivirga ehrenbergii]